MDKTWCERVHLYVVIILQLLAIHSSQGTCIHEIPYHQSSTPNRYAYGSLEHYGKMNKSRILIFFYIKLDSILKHFLQNNDINEIEEFVKQVVGTSPLY